MREGIKKAGHFACSIVTLCGGIFGAGWLFGMGFTAGSSFVGGLVKITFNWS